MDEIETTCWPEQEQAAFSVALGQWLGLWFKILANSKERLIIIPETPRLLALIWRAGRNYEREHAVHPTRRRR